MNILIIDDDPDDAMFFCEAISDIAPHLKCIATHDWKTAKESLDEFGAPEFIFLDAYMYPQGGKECLMMLGKLEHLFDTTIIIHSGLLSPAQIQEFLALGADKIMMKATSRDSLHTSLREILSIAS
jgi:response regulator of citrate/malate metabolism